MTVDDDFPNTHGSGSVPPQAVDNCMDDEHDNIKRLIEKRVAESIAKLATKDDIKNLKDEMFHTYGHLLSSGVANGFEESIVDKDAASVDVEALDAAAADTSGTNRYQDTLILEDSLPEDTYSIMMVSYPCTIPWFFGLAMNAVQFTLLGFFIYILLGAYFGFSFIFVGSRSNFSDFTSADIFINEVGKYISGFVVFMFQDDLISGLTMLTTRLNYTKSKWKDIYNSIRFTNALIRSNLKSERWQWTVLLVFPALLKLIEGILSFVVCLLFIILSKGVIELYQNFASLLIVSDIDNRAFDMACQGYFGEQCRKATDAVKSTTISYKHTTSSTRKFHVSYQILSIIALLCLTLGVIVLDEEGVLLRLRPGYSNCYVKHPIKLNDGTCNYGDYNTPECNYDGGDCKNSTAYQSCFVEDPSKVGDGFCDGDNYNTDACENDGGDCLVGLLAEYPKCFVPNIKYVGNGICDSDKDGYNILECGFDGGDCLPKNANESGYPDCFVFDLSLLGDGICHAAYPEYNSTECGNDDGDCVMMEAEDLPGCFVHSPDLLADGVCHDMLPNYNTPECGYDGGDCVCKNNSNNNDGCIDNVYNANLAGFPYCFVTNTSLVFDYYCNYDEPGYNTGVCNYDGTDCWVNEAYPNCLTFRMVSIGDHQCDSYFNYNPELLTPECGFDGGDCEPVLASGYDSCFVHRPELLGNGICNADYPGMNTTECGFDGGDCAVFSHPNFPNCYLQDLSLIGDGVCQIEYNTTECGYDGGDKNRGILGDCELKPVKGYDNCYVTNPELIGDGECNADLMNFYTEGCAFDGGDCSLHKVVSYAKCYVDDPSRVGDGKCDIEYNTEACGYDGGDCYLKKVDGYVSCYVGKPYYIGDTYCFGAEFNTEACGYDGGDCLSFNDEYPNCHVDYPYLIGDTYCDGPESNTTECGYDGGDCLPPDGYPNCDVSFIYSYMIGDGYCSGPQYNTTECGYDGGDCLVFNGYPNCNVDDPYFIGNGRCDGSEYNTTECGYDGGDCLPPDGYPDCHVEFPYYIGDGWCDGPEYNTLECGYDGGDCLLFNDEYPNCNVDLPYIVGNGVCDGSEYNTTECGYDGGDCLFV